MDFDLLRLAESVGKMSAHALSQRRKLLKKNIDSGMFDSEDVEELQIINIRLMTLQAEDYMHLFSR